MRYPESVNEDLKKLGDAYRFGQIARAEYRSRRRALLREPDQGDTDTTLNRRQEPRIPAGFGAADSSEITDRRAIGAAVTSSAEVARKSYAIPAIVAIALLAVVAAGGWWAFRSLHHESAGMATTIAGQPDETGKLESMATQFVDADDWQPSSIDAFIANWQSSDDAARGAASSRPAIVKLREQIANKLKISASLVDDAGPDSQRASQADALRRLERVLRTPG